MYICHQFQCSFLSLLFVFLAICKYTMENESNYLKSSYSNSSRHPFILHGNGSTLFGYTLSPFVNRVWNGLTEQFLHGTLFCSSDRQNWNVEWRSYIASLVVVLSPSIFAFSGLCHSLDSKMSAAVIICQLFPPTRVNTYAFQVPLANVLEM